MHDPIKVIHNIFTIKYKYIYYICRRINSGNSIVFFAIWGVCVFPQVCSPLLCRAKWIATTQPTTAAFQRSYDHGRPCWGCWKNCRKDDRDNIVPKEIINKGGVGKIRNYRLRFPIPQRWFFPGKLTSQHPGWGVRYISIRMSMEVILTSYIVSWFISPIYGTYPTYL